ncbi:uncharacterized protein LOC133874569 isoform X2 [Alnus glutinosa]|uniref:uncharacterized protein LOC133874569 isoform X2 n=1 Tax=Alnus glutinosa TaxID=3517 RepID=UPI002D7709C2|nr:uncharacterized protein LOC133874569 isoform X2 [Alnus glutinosa]
MSPPPSRAPSFFRFRRGVSHEPTTVPSSIILPVPTRSPTVYFHLHLHLRPLGTARRHHRHSPSSAKAHPPAIFQFRPSSISGRFPVPASPQIRLLQSPESDGFFLIHIWMLRTKIMEVNLSLMGVQFLMINSNFLL